jgi:hypothetical protein
VQVSLPPRPNQHFLQPPRLNQHFYNVLFAKGQSVLTNEKTNFVDSTQNSYLIDEGVDANRVLKEMLYRIGLLDISMSGPRAGKPDCRSSILGNCRNFTFNRSSHIVV